jgi:hypothetical protein
VPGERGQHLGALYMTRSEIRFNTVDLPARPRPPSALPPSTARHRPAAYTRLPIW